MVGKPVAVTHSRGKDHAPKSDSTESSDTAFSSMAEIASCSYEARQVTYILHKPCRNRLLRGFNVSFGSSGKRFQSSCLLHFFMDTWINTCWASLKIPKLQVALTRTKYSIKFNIQYMFLYSILCVKFSSSSRDLDVRHSLCLRGLSEYPHSGRSGGRSWCRM